jgi:hypothetical protein
LTTEDLMLSRLHTDRTCISTKPRGARIIGLPLATAGIELTTLKLGGARVSIRAAAGNDFYAGETIAVPTMTIAATAMGARIHIASLGASGWIVIERTPDVIPG